MHHCGDQKQQGLQGGCFVPWEKMPSTNITHLTRSTTTLYGLWIVCMMGCTPALGHVGSRLKVIRRRGQASKFVRAWNSAWLRSGQTGFITKRACGSTAVGRAGLIFRSVSCAQQWAVASFHITGLTLHLPFGKGSTASLIFWLCKFHPKTQVASLDPLTEFCFAFNWGTSLIYKIRSCPANIILFVVDSHWGPLICLRDFHPTTLKFCSMHCVNLGLCFGVNGSVLWLACYIICPILQCHEIDVISPNRANREFISPITQSQCLASGWHWWNVSILALDLSRHDWMLLTRDSLSFAAVAKFRVLNHLSQRKWNFGKLGSGIDSLKIDI